jgi:hypothetical protein
LLSVAAETEGIGEYVIILRNALKLLRKVSAETSAANRRSSAARWR